MLFKSRGGAAPVSTDPVQPAAAASYGFNRLVLYDDFTSLNTIDINNTLQPGYKWYVQMHEGIGNPSTVVTIPPSCFSINGSVLTITPSVVNANAYLVQTGYVGASGTRQVGSSIPATGAYWECRMSFDASLARSGMTSWPAFWTWDNQITLNNADSASYGGLRYTELDIIEAFPTGTGTIEPQFVDWDWPSTSGYVRNTNYSLTSLPNLSDGQMHKYGLLYVPPVKNGGTGLIQRWIDGVLHSEGNVSFSPSIISPQANNGATTGWLSGSSALGFSTMFGMYYNWPINIDYAMVWQ